MTTKSPVKLEGAGKKANRLEEYMLPVIQGRPGLAPALLRGVLACLAPVYVAGLKIFLLPYRLGLRKRFRLPVPVICVGNLTTGGTGKTPMTQLISRQLQAGGLKVVILSRGYGGENEYGCAIVSDERQVLLSAAQSGDEPYLLASSLPGIPVVVGKDRRISGTLAVDRFRPDIIVLDDGMQFWQLHRDRDIVLLNAGKPFDNGYTFPRGLLREPKSHLKRAGAIIITGATDVDEQQLEATMIKVLAAVPGKPVYTAALEASSLRSISDEVEYSRDASWLNGRRVIALCAIGNPASFEMMIMRLGARIEHSYRFRDHEAIPSDRLEDVWRHAERAGVDAIITTEKDAARIAFPSNLPGVPIMALQVNMKVEGLHKLTEDLMGLVQANRSDSPATHV